MNRILYSAGALGLAAGLVAGTVPARAQVVNVTFLHVNNILEIGARDGVGGFGYDPLFEVVEYHRTFGKLDPQTKACISHRARALRRILPELRRLAASGDWQPRV